jgi:hypothetical protein
LRRDLIAERGAFERPDQPVEVERRDDVTVAVMDQARQDLAISREVAEMADGFTDQRRRGLVGVVGGWNRGLVFPVKPARKLSDLDPTTYLSLVSLNRA